MSMGLNHCRFITVMITIQRGIEDISHVSPGVTGLLNCGQKRACWKKALCCYTQLISGFECRVSMISVPSLLYWRYRVRSSVRTVVTLNINLLWFSRLLRRKLTLYKLHVITRIVSDKEYEKFHVIRTA